MCASLQHGCVPQLIGAVGLAPAPMLASEGQIPHFRASVLSLVKRTHAHIRPMSRSVNVHLVAHFLNNNSHTVCEQTRSKTSLLL